MAKIPVGKTVAYAYSFTFGNFLTLLGITWFPMILMTIGGYFLLPRQFASIQAFLVSHDPGQGLAGYGYMLSFYLVMLLCFVMAYIGVGRAALGLDRGPVLLYFSVGDPFWRLLGTYLLIFLILFGVLFAFGLIAGIAIAVLTATAGRIGAGLGLIVIMTGMMALLIYLTFRFFFMLVPVAISEKSRVLRRSWGLTRGNFWRIFAVLLALLAPFIIAEFVLGAFAMVFAGLPPPPAPGSDPAQAAAYTAALFGRMGAVIPYAVPVLLLMHAVAIGLMISASAFAYRALVPASEGIAAEFA